MQSLKRKKEMKKRKRVRVKRILKTGKKDPICKTYVVQQYKYSTHILWRK